MADYRYLVDANIHWDNKGEKFQEIASFLEDCARDLGIGIVVRDIIQEANKLVAPLPIFDYCPYYIESMKQDYVWPYYTESAAEAYHFRVLVFATAYFLLDFFNKIKMRSYYYKAFIGQQGGIINQFKDWEAAAEKLHFHYAFEKNNHLKDIRKYDFHRNPWDKITDNFKTEVMVRILDRYKVLENKKRVLDCMEAFCLIRPQFAYMLDAERPGSIAKFREWIEKEAESMPNIIFKVKYATYEKDYMIVQHVNYDDGSETIGGRSKLPYRFFTTMFHAIGLEWCDSDGPDWNLIRLNWNRKTLYWVVVQWNKYNKTEVLPNSEEGFECVGNEHIAVDIWLSFYALLFLKADRKDWEDQLMQNMRTVLPQTDGWRDHRLDRHEGNVFDKIEEAFKKEERHLTDADFQANLVEWDHLDEKDWAYATRGYAKDDMLIFIKAGRTHVEQWKIAEALEKSYAQLVDSEEMSKIENFNALVDLENFKDEILQGTYLEGAKPIDMDEMNRRLKRTSYEDMEKEVERLKAENERLKAENEGGIKGRVTKDLALAIWSLIKDKVDMDGKTTARNWCVLINKLSGFGIQSLYNDNGSDTLKKDETEIKEMNAILKKVGLPEIKKGEIYKL